MNTITYKIDSPKQIPFQKLIPRNLPPKPENCNNSKDYQQEITQLKKAGFELYGAHSEITEETKDHATLTATRLTKEGWECSITVTSEYIMVWRRRANELPPKIQTLIKSGLIKAIDSE